MTSTPICRSASELGSFLLFPELEVGADLTNNVLDTHFDTRSDMGPELKPRVRLDSDWGRHSLSFEANADRIWYSDFPFADTKNYQLLARGRLDVMSRTHLSGEIEKSHVQENSSSISITDISNANTAVEEQHRHCGARAYLQPADPEVHRHGSRLRLRRRYGPRAERPGAVRRYQGLPRHDRHAAKHL